MNNNIRQVIVMRSDLGMRKGKMIAQGAHASMKILLDCKVSNPSHSFVAFEFTDIMRAWIEGIFTKICVKVDSEEALLNIYNSAKEAGLCAALIRDAGLTEFKEPTYTCCAIGPDLKEKLDPITGALPLL